MFVDVLLPTTQHICGSFNFNGKIKNEFFTFNAAVVPNSLEIILAKRVIA